MAFDVAFVGFGEAGYAFGSDPRWSGSAGAYDRLTEGAATRGGQRDRYARAGVIGAETLRAAVAQAPLILSVVTADEALAAAVASAALIEPTSLYFDMNSVAPGTKRTAAAAIEAGGGNYIDVAIMAPVTTTGLRVPLLLSGPAAGEGAARLKAIGFTDVSVVSNEIGTASSIKMIRSVMIKGIEALSAEMMEAATAANVEVEVLASLGDDWDERARYNLERMATHGTRRAAEMREAAITLEALGVEPIMTRGTVLRQAAAAVGTTLAAAA